MTGKILKTSLYFTVLSTAASAVNFLFYPLISHLLSTRSFGDVQVGVSFIMLAAALFTSLSTLALFASARSDISQDSINHVERIVISASIAASLVVLIFAPSIATWLQLHDTTLLYTLAAVFILNIPGATWLGSLQGNGQFIESGWISLSAALIKLGGALVFISLGLDTQGALLGIGLGTFAILPLAKLFDHQKKIRYSQTFRFVGSDTWQFLRTKPGLGLLLTALVFFATIANLDIITAKILLSPEAAGSYAQISTAAKIPYFAAIPITLIIFGKYLQKQVKLTPSLLIFASGIAVAAILTVIFSNPLLAMLFNYRGSQASLLNNLVMAFSMYSIVTLLSYVLIARRRVLAALIAAASGLAITIAMLMVAHTPEQIATNFMYSQLLTLLLYLGLSYTGNYE